MKNNKKNNKAKGKKVKEKKKISPKKLEGFDILNPNAAGIDIGSDQHWISLPPERAEESVRKFGAFTSDLYELADCLVENGITTVAMESTGIYWIPLFQILEEKGIEVNLINARLIKIVDARGKTDAVDCQWIRKLHACGLLRASFRPEMEICQLRSLLRHRDNLVKIKAKHVQHMQKSLEQMNIKLSNVISDITGQTGLKIIRAILKGERDVHKLAQLKHYMIKASPETIAKSLVGDYRTEHLFTLKLALDAFEFTFKQMRELDRLVETLLKEMSNHSQENMLLSCEFSDLPQEPIRKKKRRRQHNAPDYDVDHYINEITQTDLVSAPGIKDRALDILSEIGLDMTKWKTSSHFTSWIGLSPNRKISGGKILSEKTPKVRTRLAKIFRNAATSIQNSNTYLGAFYRKIRARKGPACAVTATARKIAVIVYNMIKNKTSYSELGNDYLTKLKEKNIIKNIKKQARSLGFTVSLEKNLC